MTDALPRWERTIQRNFPPFALSTSVSVERRGLSIGPLRWKRGREVVAKFGGEQCSIFMNPAQYYISNIAEVVRAVNPEFEKAMDERNASIFDAVRVMPGSTREDLHTLNETHQLVYALMLIGYDIAGDLRAIIDAFPGANDVDGYISSASEATAVERERGALAQARLAGDDSMPERLSREFGFLHQDYLGEPWTFEEYRKALTDSASVEAPRSEAPNLDAYDDYQRWVLTMFRKNLYLYEEGRNAMVRVVWAMKETYRALGEDPQKLLYSKLSEVTAFAAGEAGTISDSLYAERKEAYGASFDDDSLTEIEGKAAVEALLKAEGLDFYWKEAALQAVTELKGRTAHKGHAQGKARLVFNQADADLVEDGDILISPMTQVEFLSGLRKCGAIVTDEGGIVCHAAIVAREFGKPCILATRNATKVFRNGDLVEVDADTGIVRLLTRVQ